MKVIYKICLIFLYSILPYSNKNKNNKSLDYMVEQYNRNNLESLSIDEYVERKIDK